MFYSLDAEWRFTYINRRTEAYWGLPREEFVGKRLWDVSPEARGSLVQIEFERAVREIAHISRHLLDDLVTSAAPRDREVEAAKARERAAKRFGTAAA